MHSNKEVKKKLRTVKRKYLSRQYKEKLSQCPKNCVNNYRHTSTNEEGEEVEIGLCLLAAENPEEWQGFICDDEETAKNCPYFSCKNTRESIQSDFEEKLEDEVVVANSYKDIAALQWVLEEKVYSWDQKWYQAFWVWFVFQLHRISCAIRNMGLG